MEHDLASHHRVVDPLVALDVPLDQLRVLGERQHVGAPARGEVVEDPKLVTERGQVRGQVRADESPSSSDQDLHRALPVARERWLTPFASVPERSRSCEPEQDSFCPQGCKKPPGSVPRKLTQVAYHHVFLTLEIGNRLP
jgi:hypothetical protein